MRIETAIREAKGQKKTAGIMIRLSDETKAEFEKAARCQKVKPSTIGRLLIEQYLADYRKVKR